VTVGPFFGVVFLRIRARVVLACINCQCVPLNEGGAATCLDSSSVSPLQHLPGCSHIRSCWRQGSVQYGRRGEVQGSSRWERSWPKSTSSWHSVLRTCEVHLDAVDFPHSDVYVVAFYAVLHSQLALRGLQLAQEETSEETRHTGSGGCPSPASHGLRAAVHPAKRQHSQRASV
jgi:hypothetical protein